jgi:hypothetical protein
MSHAVSELRAARLARSAKPFLARGGSRRPHRQAQRRIAEKDGKKAKHEQCDPDNADLLDADKPIAEHIARGKRCRKLLDRVAPDHARQCVEDRQQCNETDDQR